VNHRLGHSNRKWQSTAFSLGLRRLTVRPMERYYDATTLSDEDHCSFCQMKTGYCNRQHCSSLTSPRLCRKPEDSDRVLFCWAYLRIAVLSGTKCRRAQPWRHRSRHLLRVRTFGEKSPRGNR
jgi:hypothetical protein